MSFVRMRKSISSIKLTRLIFSMRTLEITATLCHKLQPRDQHPRDHSKGRYWEAGEWKEVEPMSVRQVYDFPVVGPQDAYLLYHEEMESLCQNIPASNAFASG